MVVGWLLGADLVASLVAGIALVGAVAAARWRRPLVYRVALTAVVCVVAVSAALVALTLPTFRESPRPLVVTRDETLPTQPVAGGVAREALGFVASDYDDSADGIARDGRRVSTLAATAATMTSADGNLESLDAGDALSRAHVSGAAAQAVISNAGPDGFDGQAVAAALSNPATSSRLISQIAGLAGDGWDGVVLDFEGLPPTVRAAYPAFVTALHQAMPGRRLLVASPAYLDPASPEAAGYDLGTLDRAGDGVVWMAYDQHFPGSEPGAVAELGWVRDSLAVAVQSVPRQRLLLGVAGYGYRWDRANGATPLTFPDAERMAASSGASTQLDPAAAETQIRTPDGATAWFSGAIAITAHAELANTFNLAGVALWRVGAEDPTALSMLPFLVRRAPPPPGRAERAVAPVNARGLVALTFDDGPDPVWTPQILAVLRQKRVPATFFAIGQSVEDNPDLVRTEVADGHTIGNHTFSHPHLESQPSWRVHYELWHGSAAIEEVTGYRPRLFRSPYDQSGSSGSRRAGSTAEQAVSAAGMYAVPWQVDSLDYTNPGVDTIVHNVTSAVGEHSIVLMHDAGGDRAQTLAALPRIIDQLRAAGYEFSTVDGLDGAVGAPYLGDRGPEGIVARVATVAGLRLWHGLSLIVFAVLAVGVAVGVVRVVVGLGAGMVHVRRGRRAYRQQAATGDPPVEGLRVAVVIPAYNEARVITKTLLSLTSCHPAPGEVIVVDDGSRDDTAELARSCQRQLPNLRVLTQPNQGKAAALNTGIAATDADIVVVLDADTQATSGLISELTAPFTDPQVGGVAGNVKVGNRRNPIAAMQSLEYVISLNVDRRAQDVLGIISVVPGAAGAFRRTALEQVGGYPAQTLVEDADLTQTLLLAGWRIRYAPHAVVYTEAPQTLRDVIKQRRRWSYGTVQVAAKHAPALLDPRAGRAGMIGLPWLVATQVVLPAFGPFADLWLVYCLLTGRVGVAAVAVALAIALDLLLTAVAIALDRESWTMILLSPALRLLWRPLQLVVVARALNLWLAGRSETWRRVTRYAAVHLAPLKQADEPPRTGTAPTPRGSATTETHTTIEAQLESATSRLVARHAEGDDQHAAQIRRLVRESAATFDHATVRRFVPILVERAVRGRIAPDDHVPSPRTPHTIPACTPAPWS